MEAAALAPQHQPVLDRKISLIVTSMQT